MKTKLFLFFLLPLMVACGGNNRPKQTESEEVASVTEVETLKGEVIPLDTVLFRYAYRIRVAGDRAVMLDLHNPDYYFHVFTYPGFSYLSSFGHRGEGPGEFLGTGNVRFDGKDAVWALDDSKNRLLHYVGIADGKAPQLDKDMPIDEKLLRSLDFDLLDASTFLVPDYSGENRFCWVNLATGALLRKWQQIPEDEKLLAESAPAVAQGWNSRHAFSPDRKKLVTVTQFGDRLDIYDVKGDGHVFRVGEFGGPAYHVAGDGQYIPEGICYYDMQATDRYIYALYDGRLFKEVIKDPDNYKQGGQELRVFNYQGVLLKAITLDRRLSGLYVDEANGWLFGTDVNADEQLVRYEWKMD